MPAPSMKAKTLHRISKLVDKVFEDREIYRREIDKPEFLETWSTQMDKKNTSPEELLSITEKELTHMIKQMMAFRALGSLLDGLTPEQVENFNAAVEGR